MEREVLAKINSTLEPLIGADRFRAGVSADCDFTGGEQSEETFDPAKSVMVSSQKTEDASGAGMASGLPGTASNLASSTARPGGSRGFSKRTENVAYQSSRVVRHLRLAQGTIKKMSVAVLLDQDLRWEGQGRKMQRVLVPPSPEKLEKIRELIAGSIGLTPERGDKLIVESLPFESTLNAEPPVLDVPARKNSKDNLLLEQVKENIRLLIAGVAAVVVLLALFIIVLLRRGKARKAKAARRKVRFEEVGEFLPPAEEAKTAGSSSLPAAQPAPAAAESAGVASGAAVAALPEPVPASLTGRQQGLFTRIEMLSEEVRDVVDRDADVCVAILRGWLKEEKR